MSATATPGRARTERGKSDEFWTPRDVVAELQRLNDEPYAVDLAANARNAVAPLWVGPDVLGLGNEYVRPASHGSVGEDWTALSVLGPMWGNWPFSKPNLPSFTGKAIDSAPRLHHPLDMLVPVSTRAGWFRRIWEGDVVGSETIHAGPLRGQVLRYSCNGYDKQIIFLGYALAFLEDGVETDSALGSHCIVRLSSKESWRRQQARETAK